MMERLSYDDYRRQGMLRHEKYNLPSHTLIGLTSYVVYGYQPGGFLYSFLINDLMGAASKADDENKMAFHEIARFLWNEVPANSFGTPEKVVQWLEMHQKWADEDEKKYQADKALQPDPTATLDELGYN